MFLPARNNQFEFFFGKGLVPEEIEAKYKPYFDRIPGNSIVRCIDFINYGIQGFNLPGLNFNPIVQIDRSTPYGRIYRTPASPETTMEKDITITSQLYDGYLNYFLWLDLYYYYYNSPQELFLPGVPYIRIFDGQGYETLSIEFKNILFTSIDNLDFNFSSNTIDMKTFNCTFKAQEVSIKLAV